MQADPDRKVITIAAREPKYQRVGDVLGVYEGDQLLLLGSTTVTGVKQAGFYFWFFSVVAFDT